jgi:hypothetical protein
LSCPNCKKTIEEIEDRINQLSIDMDIWKNQMSEDAFNEYYGSAYVAQMEVESLDKTIEILKIIKTKLK